MPPTAAPLLSTSGLRTVVGRSLEDPAWDDFLRRAVDGHHTQTSTWASVKAVSGWHAVRVKIESERGIEAGAQLLLRRVPGGRIGYVTNGPVINGRAGYAALVARELKRLAAAEKVRFLIVQPPEGAELTYSSLRGLGFSPGATPVAPTATVLVDLRPTPDEVMAQMRQKTRQNIRGALKKGVRVREGTEADLPAFLDLLSLASGRRGFEAESPEFYRRMWQVMEPAGCLKLFVAEFEGEAISALLVTPFRDAIVCKRGAWSGKYPELHPNHLMFWTAMLWAREHGYTWCDLDGIERATAEAVLSGRYAHTERKYGTDDFKLQFGGRVVLSPLPLEYLPNPLLRAAYHGIAGRLLRTSTLRGISNRLRVARGREPSAAAGSPGRDTGPGERDQL
jgi:peptidoglycan pentaglycine glycine transferase (the first glycine)